MRKWHTAFTQVHHRSTMANLSCIINLAFLGTSSVASYPLVYKSRSFVIVDTPGFDDSRISDREVLRTLVTWLESSFRAGEKLGGIIYFHRITDPRMQGSALSNLHTFKQLCGQDWFKNVVLGTSFWGVVDETLGKEREKQLKENGNFWAGMMHHGSQVLRIPETQQEARDLIFRFAGNTASVLQSQRETVIEGKSFEQTAATQQLQREMELEKQREENERQRREQQTRHEVQLRAKEMKAFVEAQAAREEQQRKIAIQERERKRLEAQRVAEEAKRKAAEEAAKVERERLEREAAELAKRMENLKIERATAARTRKRDQHFEEVKIWLEVLCAAQEANKIMVKFREVSDVYNAVCDNCFCTLGSAVRYSKSYSVCRIRNATALMSARVFNMQRWGFRPVLNLSFCPISLL